MPKVPPDRTVAAMATAAVTAFVAISLAKSEHLSAESTQRAPPQFVLPAGHFYQQTGPFPS
jgi:hypothetical protein